MDKSLELLVNVGGTPIPVQGEDQDECVCGDDRGRFHEQ